MPARLFALASFALYSLSFMTPSWAVPGGYGDDTRSYNIAHGRVVFKSKCMRCHESGRRGAPVLGDTEDWRERVQQPLDILIRHAIDGHCDMPPRGDAEITEQEVAAAVAYVVDRARNLITADAIDRLPPSAAGDRPSARTERRGADARAAAAPLPGADQAVMQMFMMLLGKERWK